MEQLPFYIYLVFIATTLATLLLFVKAGGFSRTLILVTTSWLALQAIAGSSGFYTVTNTLPPRLALLVFPPLIFIFILFLSKSGRSFIDGLEPKTLTLLHTVRIPVELTLYWLCLHKAVPAIITFEGRNFDVLSGLSAPVVYYFGYIRKVTGRGGLIAWNVICLLLLTNVVTTAILSTPFPFQRFGFGQPNIAILYFPFIWLPCFIVPTVLFSHLVSLRKLFTNQ